MHRITITLHGELAALIHPRRSAAPTAPEGLPEGALWVRLLREPASVKDSIEALGIPHTEMDLILINDRPVTFSALVADGDVIDVHPTPPAWADPCGNRLLPTTGGPRGPGRESGPPPAWPGHRLQPRPLARDRLVCDQHLGKLARLLRVIGFDTRYEPGWEEAEVAACATAESRAVLTCSHSLLKRREIACGRLIRSRQPDRQAGEVIRRFGPVSAGHSFARCSLCNGELGEVSREEVNARIPPRTRLWRDRYALCRRCGHLYWEGTHVESLRVRIAAIQRDCQGLQWENTGKDNPGDSEPPPT